MRISDWSSDVCSSDLLRRVCSMFAPPHHVSTCLHCVSCALLEGTALPNTHVMEPIGRCEHQTNTSRVATTTHYPHSTCLFDVRTSTPCVYMSSLCQLCVPGGYRQIGRAHVRPLVTNAPHLCLR